MKLSVPILSISGLFGSISAIDSRPEDRFIERGPVHFQECIDNGLDFISKRDPADGRVECSGNVCVLKCETTKGFQTYGGKAWKVKCIKTKKGYKWNKQLGICRTCNPLKYKQDQFNSKEYSISILQEYSIQKLFNNLFSRKIQFKN